MLFAPGAPALGLCIGAGTEQMVYNFDGELDEVRVYGRALVDGEIKALAHPSGRE